MVHSMLGRAHTRLFSVFACSGGMGNNVHGCSGGSSVFELREGNGRHGGSLPDAQIRYEEAERRSTQENQRLTLDFQRTAAAFGALQAKFARFQDSGISKFRKVACL